ncbi:MAG TPA: ABC transporter ATP-binding protein [Lactobacillaceae bacterium]|jgi:ABC-2 type transport system ATP-binding protein
MSLQLSNVTKQFGDKEAVSQLNLTIAPGEVMGLIGQNGAGKTTTFRMILDFIQPTQGKILLNDRAIDDKAKQKIGFLPEERGLYQKWTVEEQILYFAELHGMKRGDARIALQDWLKKLEVVGAASDKVQKLSKGNAQKIQLIATIIFQPELLILDEPFSGLDPVNTAILMNEIDKLKQAGAMILFSSHNMDGVAKLSDNVTMLKHGQTVLQGNVQGIREQFGRTQVYVETALDDAELQAIDGVLSLEKQGSGRLLRLRDEAVGQTIFDKVSAGGYAQAFMQTPPTLDEIFRNEVADEHTN